MKQISRIAPLFLAFCSIALGGLKNAQSFAQDLPMIFWYTLEQWGKVERGTDSGVSFEKFKEGLVSEVIGQTETTNGNESWKFHLYYPDYKDNQDEGWLFVFCYDGNWKEVSGVKRMWKKDLQLFKSDFFTPSMRPQMKESLELYNSGKLFDIVKSKVR